MTSTGEREISVISRRLLDNPGELACMYTRVEFVVGSFPCFERFFFSGYSGLYSPQKLTCPKSNSTKKKVTLRAETTFSLCELTAVQFSIVHAQNSSRDSQAKLIVRFVIKWRKFHGNKNNNFDLLPKTQARLSQCSKLSKTGKKPVF